MTMGAICQVGMFGSPFDDEFEEGFEFPLVVAFRDPKG